MQCELDTTISESVASPVHCLIATVLISINADISKTNGTDTQHPQKPAAET